MIFSVFQKKLVWGYSWSTLLWHRCYYPHRSRDALSPVCGIFSTRESTLRLTGWSLSYTINNLWFNIIFFFTFWEYFRYLCSSLNKTVIYVGPGPWPKVICKLPWAYLFRDLDRAPLPLPITCKQILSLVNLSQFHNWLTLVSSQLSN